MQPVPEGVYRHKINGEKPTHDTKGDNMENNKEKRISCELNAGADKLYISARAEKGKRVRL